MQKLVNNFTGSEEEKFRLCPICNNKKPERLFEHNKVVCDDCFRKSKEFLNDKRNLEMLEKSVSFYRVR